MQESFYVGGRYVETERGTVMAGQAYVQHRAPDNPVHPYPIVMIHAGGQTAMNFETTPDGREGWANYLVSEGFHVYLVDQPGRGRSPAHSDVDGPARGPATAHVEKRFTATAHYNLWKTATLHTQWPGPGRQGDPIFDQFYATQFPSLLNRIQVERNTREAGAALLDKIGPAIVLTHSQSGEHGWVIADARPGLVKAVLAIEPHGPPVFDLQQIGPPEFQPYGEFARPYGITQTEIAYDPPVIDPAADLGFIQEPAADREPLVACYLQQEPARQLVNIAKAKVLVVTGEASYHASYDHCTVKYLRQAGVDVTHIRLEEIGVLGNGHMMVVEKNNREIIAIVHGWLKDQELAST